MMISSGSVGTFCSQTTLPVLSTTHTAVSFTETSRPTKCVISIAPSSHPEVEVAPVWILYVEGLRSIFGNAAAVIHHLSGSTTLFPNDLVGSEAVRQLSKRP